MDFPDTYDIKKWVGSVLLNHSFNHSKGFISDTEIIMTAVVKTGWSAVYKVETSIGVYYVKVAPDTFREPQLLSYIKDNFTKPAIAEIVAIHPDFSLYLMKSCGDISLRTHQNGQFDFDLWAEGIKQYMAIQKESCSHQAELKCLGVPDWSFAALPYIYETILNDHEFLEVYGVNPTLRDEGRFILGKCEDLSIHYPELVDDVTLNFCDFHDNNMIYDKTTQAIRLIDIGESAFYPRVISLIDCLNRATFRYKIDPQAEIFRKMATLCFGDDYGDVSALLQKTAFLMQLYTFLGTIRLYKEITPSSLTGEYAYMKDRINKSFRLLIDSASED